MIDWLIDWRPGPELCLCVRMSEWFIQNKHFNFFFVLFCFWRQIVQIDRWSLINDQSFFSFIFLYLKHYVSILKMMMMMTKFSYDSNGGGGGGNVYATHTHTHIYMYKYWFDHSFWFLVERLFGIPFVNIIIIVSAAKQTSSPFLSFQKKRNFFHTDFFPFFFASSMFTYPINVYVCCCCCCCCSSTNYWIKFIYKLESINHWF